MAQNQFSRSFNPISHNMYPDYLDMKKPSHNPVPMPISGHPQRPPAGHPHMPHHPDNSKHPSGGHHPGGSHQPGMGGVTQGYLQQVLQKNIGQQVRIDFLIGTNMIVDKAGTIREVGIDYVTIQLSETDDYLVCDLYSIKFVQIYK